MTRDAAPAAPLNVLITGASSGIGLELARLFAADGHRLMLTARRAERLEAVAAGLRELGAADTRDIPADLAAPDGVERLLEGIAGEPPVDVLVNNAGFGIVGPFAETDASAEMEMIQVNIGAVTHLTKALLPDILERRGRILNVASTAAFQPGPFMAVYYATKAFVLSFGEALAEELSGTGVTVTTLCPGPTETGFASRAGMQESRLFRHGVIADARSVAEAGYAGLFAGERVVVPGAVNKVLAQAVRVAPRRLVTRIGRELNGGRMR